jgi:hypothetical protein
MMLFNYRHGILDTPDADRLARAGCADQTRAIARTAISAARFELESGSSSARDWIEFPLRASTRFGIRLTFAEMIHSAGEQRLSLI